VHLDGVKEDDQAEVASMLRGLRCAVEGWGLIKGLSNNHFCREDVRLKSQLPGQRSYAPVWYRRSSGCASSRIEVERRLGRVKTDWIDTNRLLSML